MEWWGLPVDLLTSINPAKENPSQTSKPSGHPGLGTPLRLFPGDYRYDKLAITDNHHKILVKIRQHRTVTTMNTALAPKGSCMHVV